VPLLPNNLDIFYIKKESVDKWSVYMNLKESFRNGRVKEGAVGSLE
jgi:hypothetical protein